MRRFLSGFLRWLSRTTVALVALVWSPLALAAEITCTGPFAKDSNHQRLVQTFGAANVVVQKVYVGEGQESRATVVHPKNQKQRIEVIWWDEKSRSRPSMIKLKGSEWSGPEGVKVGTPLVDVERANGKPFSLHGFGWDLGGFSTSWQGGALDRLPGGCNLVIRFDHAENAPETQASQVLGEKEFASNFPPMKAVKPKVAEVAFGFPNR